MRNRLKGLIRIRFIDVADFRVPTFIYTFPTTFVGIWYLSTWLWSYRRRYRGILLLVVLIAFVVFTWRAYVNEWGWTGFVDYKGAVGDSGNRAKTLWDWMSLIIIPAALAGGALWFNRQQGRRNQKLE